ncbi:disulfide isomerase [Pseudidiomarina aestuarii]|uniref:Thiol:disulfide interchange protein n=1 Tax=Pseudidiomarina aestuarii TaxID=624146 RepID=A0A7Z7EUJ3_9GAMM|nr:thiol:disulfide interchange protein DsbA/DsbL [Pseudidiomarina aestuarii]RUO42231.1 disulfide isomerase [Pseudidiomarina aestuarii]
MKKLLFAVVALMMFPVAAQQFEEGVHYDIVSEKATDKPEIREFFSYFCVHCYRFEPIAQAMKAEFPDAFDKAHVSFINYAGMGVDMSRAYVVAKQLGKEDQIGQAIFNRNFVQQDMINSKEDLAEVFAAIDMSAEELEKAMNSFSVRGMANKMDRDAGNLRVNATPTFIVNGKYKMNPQGFQGTEDFQGDFLRLAGYLLELDQ